MKRFLLLLAVIIGAVGSMRAGSWCSSAGTSASGLEKKVYRIYINWSDAKYPICNSGNSGDASNTLKAISTGTAQEFIMYANGDTNGTYSMMTIAGDKWFTTTNSARTLSTTRSYAAFMEISGRYAYGTTDGKLYHFTGATSANATSAYSYAIQKDNTTINQYSKSNTTNAILYYYDDGAAVALNTYSSEFYLEEVTDYDIWTVVVAGCDDGKVSSSTTGVKTTTAQGNGCYIVVEKGVTPVFEAVTVGGYTGKISKTDTDTKTVTATYLSNYQEQWETLKATAESYVNEPYFTKVQTAVDALAEAYATTPEEYTAQTVSDLQDAITTFLAADNRCTLPDDGYYYLKTYNEGKYVYEDDSQTYPLRRTTNSDETKASKYIFRIKKLSNGNYTFRNVSTGKYLDGSNRKGDTQQYHMYFWPESSEMQIEPVYQNMIGYCAIKVTATSVRNSQYMLGANDYVDTWGNSTTNHCWALEALDISSNALLVAQEAAYDAIEAKATDSKLGTGVHKYNYTIGSNAYTTVATAKAGVAAVTDAANIGSFVINQPEVGKYYTIKGNQTQLYISNNETTTGQYERFEQTSTKNSAIMRVDADSEGNKKLISYSSGKYVNVSSSSWGWIIGLTNAGNVEFIEGSGTNGAGYYQIKTSQSAFLYDSNSQNSHIDRGGTNNSNERYNQWILEEVTELPLTTNADGYATYSAAVPVTIPEGCRAFVAASKGEDNVAMTKITGNIAANTGIILRTTEGNADLTFAIVSEGTAYSDNKLTANVATANIAKEGNYFFGKVSGVYCFAGLSTTNSTSYQLAGHKCYLDGTKLTSSSARNLTISWEDEDTTTGIDGIISAQPISDGKFVDNGRMVIVKNGVRYNVSGQIVK